MCFYVVIGHRLQILQVDVLVAEAIEAYNIGELQPVEVSFTSVVMYNMTVCL